MDEFDLLDLSAEIEEDNEANLTGTIENLNAPGSEVTLDIDWGDSITESVGIIDGGSDDTDGEENGSISFSISHTYSEVGNFTIDVDAQEEIISGDDVVFVIDVSASTADSSGIDVDGDDSEDSILEAEVAAFKALNQNLIDRGLGDSAKVSIVTFDDIGRLVSFDLDPGAASGLQTFTNPSADNDGDGNLDIDQALDTLSPGLDTDFAAGLQQAIQAIENAGTSPGDGTVIFLSDGENGGGDFTEQVAAITNELEQNLRAFGIDEQFNSIQLDQLRQIDPNAVQFTNIQDLLNLFDGAEGSTENNDSESIDILVSDNDIGDNPVLPNLVSHPLSPINVSEDSNNLTGTEDNERLNGNDSPNLLEGFGGIDVLDGRAGNDNLNGGGGIDTAVYQFDPEGVIVNLAEGNASDGFGNEDTLISIENILGSDFNDNITGDDQGNSLTGREGDDIINGEDGDDLLLGSAGADELTGGDGDDRFIYVFDDDGSDTITDFKQQGDDKIYIVGALFPGDLSGRILPLPASQFFEGSEATSADHRFGFNASTGELLFDEDGSGNASSQVLATLTDLESLSATDIVVL